MSEKKKFDVKKWIVWVLTMLFSVTAVFIGNRIVTENLSFFTETGDLVAKATINEVLDKSSDEFNLGGDANYQNTMIYFTATIENGPYENEEILGQQMLDSMYAGTEYIKEIEPGDSVLLIGSEEETLSSGRIVWQFSDYYRLDKIFVLAAVFMGLVMLIGRWKGVNTIISLALTFSFVFFVFVPAVMNGSNAYVWAAITCVYTIIMTLLLINGASKKTLATISGCVAGTVIAAAGTCIMSVVLNLTGYVDEHSYYLTMLNPDNPIDLTSIIFAAIIIGALGAIMDVAMDISSSLYELSEHVPGITFGKLCRSGMSIGRDIMGTMANTLVLAYIGSSLSCIMILLTYSMSMDHLMNREVIIVELLQALIGSLAILLTIPATVVICGVLYLGRHKNHNSDKSADGKNDDFADWIIE